MFNLQLCEGKSFRSHTETLEYMKSLRFKVIPYMLCSTAEEVERQIQSIGENREQYSFDIDGAVVKVNDLEQRTVFGSTAKFPRWPAPINIHRTSSPLLFRTL